MGPLTVWVSSAGVRRIEFGSLPRDDHTERPGSWPSDLQNAVAQIEEYLNKDRTIFDLKLDFGNTTSNFQKEVYEQLLKIKYGHVVSYGHIARDIEKPNMARAIGQAVGANPIPIVVPCHRVVGADGHLTGFSGGLKAKVGLLTLEGIDVDGSQANSRVHPEVIPLDL